MKKINGFNVDDFDGFAYDGCHKIYLYKHYDAEEFKKLGYTLYSFDKLIECYLNSCSLRFIDAYDSKKRGNSKYIIIVQQFKDKVEFEGFGNYTGGDTEDFDVYNYEYNSNTYWNDYKIVIERKQEAAG